MRLLVANLSILILDKNRQRCESLSLLLDFMEYNFQQVNSLEQANDLDNKYFDLILIYETDDLVVRLKNLNECFPSSKVSVLYSEDKPLVEDRFRQYPNFLGLLEFPVKKQPLNKILAVLNEAFVDDFSKEPQEENTQCDSSTSNNAIAAFLDNSFVGESIIIKQVKKLITQVAKSNASVLILGESGTGKEVIANCLHQLSKRNNMPYVPINCGAIPKDLLESELFGHEKGAFTGALTARKGRFEMAHGGSLFLDEIGDMPLAMQVKILRVLQERIFERVGGNKSLKADVRVIAATHRNLEDQVKEGSFREDLFYRLNVFPIEIPALRERTEDIPLLFNVINQRMQEDTENSVRLSPAAMASLMQHNWPGNVRELSNLIERLGIIYADEKVEWDDLPEKYQYDITHVSELPDLEQKSELELSQDVIPQEPIQIQNENEQEDDRDVFSDTQLSPVSSLPKEDFDLKEHMATLEYALIQQALEESDGVVAHAAKRLNMRRTTLVEKMKKYENMFNAKS
ncbi:MAG: sigma-54 dependent transcriptional regulator [gamma proteobacterium symbiont of Taylorina sp.]|nr:sigma-54 dependent transcriptional regulator [gamma proteobacterium symbiont of Taylorina sp.]